MLNFTVGPVMTDEHILQIAGESAPYFRTPEFSKLMLENEAMMLELLHAPEGSSCVFLTTSGTGAMESAVMNILNDRDKVLVINGGSFGQRFADLCRLHKREMTEIRCTFGQDVTKEQLYAFADQGYTALLVNMHETSSGVLYDMPMISRFCKENHLLLIVDAISAFLADELDMEELGAACVLTGSQKALAVHPGIALMALAPEAVRRVEENPEVCAYLSLKEALKNAERGQTPYTPAVSALLQIHERLRMIQEKGGAEVERKRIRSLAAAFREAMQVYPFVMATDHPSNAVTALRMPNGGAKKLIEIMKDEYRIWLCPNGGTLADEVFRVGHIGAITDADMETLLQAFADMH
ncbi:MAG: aminotransferase class V-fold PLP-dependent enzyme, partial [Eubacteriales bacterium]|nr:aminotransferase class V-fold PLP-dependent enzyme [Eubacteriales bacterium]